MLIVEEVAAPLSSDTAGYRKEVRSMLEHLRPSLTIVGGSSRLRAALEVKDPVVWIPKGEKADQGKGSSAAGSRVRIDHR